MRVSVICICLVAPFLLCKSAAASAPARTNFAQNAGAKGPALDQNRGVPLTADSNLTSSVTVDAVLLPYDVVKRTFSKEVADRYAVVQMTISNQNPNPSLIVQSALLDDRHWLLSGNLSLQPTAQLDADPKAQYHSANDPAQIASVEARLVRGELQDQQPYTFRNLFIRSAVAVGTIASGFSFLSASPNVLAGIGAYGNGAIPALGLLLPDNSLARINRISDFGFQTNKVIGKSSSDIIVGFFPLDRFLTPPLRKVYKKAPAAFFNPLELILDDKNSRPLYDMMTRSGAFKGTTAEAQRQEIADAFATYELIKVYKTRETACGVDAACVSQLVAQEPKLKPEQERLLALLNRASLNNIRVIVGGIMTVDENKVPAIVTSVVPDASDTTPLAAGPHTVVLTGSFLGGGEPSVSGSDALTISAVTAVSGKSSDTRMIVTYTLKQPITSSTTAIPFVVTKTAKDGTQTVSAPVKLAVAPAVATVSLFTPTESGAAAWTAGSHNGTLTGTNLIRCSPGVLGGTALGISSIAVDTAAAPAASVSSVPVTYVVKTALTPPAKVPVFCTMPGPTVNDTPVNTAPFVFQLQ